MIKEFKNKEIIQSNSHENLDDYYNWMCDMIGHHNTSRDYDDVTIKISDLSTSYEHIEHDEKYLRASFTLCFQYEECSYEHPKWFRYYFYQALLEPHKGHLQDKTSFTKPPGKKFKLKSSELEFSKSFVKHINPPH